MITKKELCSLEGKIMVFRLLKVESITLESDTLSLDQIEFQDVYMRNIESQLMNNRDCFFSHELDLTNSLQFMLKDGLDSKGLDYHRIDDRFFWNRSLLGTLLCEEYFSFIVPLICGFVGTIPLSIATECRVVLLSRIATSRAGTRYWTRGVDAKGDVAIEVETDILAISADKTASFRIHRGSVPIMWDQFDLTLDKRPPVNLTKATTNTSLYAMQLHFNRLQEIYGNNIFVLDMIDCEAVGKMFAELSHIYEQVNIRLTTGYQKLG